MNKERKLALEIRKHNKAYWEDKKPLISDQKYDAQVSELRELNPEHALLSFIGSDSSGRKKVKHSEPMLSLDKCYDEDGLLAWASKVSRDDTELFEIAPKYDGISSFKEEELLLSRGDGETGEDITDAISKMETSPSSGRGEIVVFKSDLEKYRDQLPRPYKTCRSAAAGLVNNQDLPAGTPKILRFMSFDFVDSSLEFQDFKSIDWVTTMEDFQNLDVPTDGIVISLADKAYGESLGMTDHHPRHSIALKYRNPTGETKLKSITWQLGKYKLTPVAELEPVEISGYTHKRASLHNWDQIQRLQIKIGNKVCVQRCGDVIPNIVGVVKSHQSHKEIEIPNCPACGELCEISGVDIVCGNPSCEGGESKKLLDSLNRLGFEDVGPAIANELIKLGIKSAAGVLNMIEPEWRRIPGFKTKSSRKHFNGAQKILRSEIEDFKLLASLNIKGFGLSLARKVMAVMTISELRTVTPEDLEKVDGIGDTMASRVTNEINSVDLINLLKFLSVKETKGLADMPLVCFTGKSDRPRDEWIKMAAGAGYLFNKAVTKKLSLLVTGGRSSTKSKKAEKNGIEVITYAEFEERI